MTDLPPVRHPSTPARLVAVRSGLCSGSDWGSGSGAVRERPDQVVTEEPMEIRLAGPGQEPFSVAVTMRTPTADFELAVGFLHSEGLLRAGQVRSVRYCELEDGTDQQYNIVTVRVAAKVDPPPLRNFNVGASCGLCGKTSLDELAGRCPIVLPGPTVAASVIASLPDRLREGQQLFTTTGGLHAAGVFDPEGGAVVIREDVGRHNAVDKVVGHALLAGQLPLTGHLLAVSGRVSFEIVEKAAMAGIGLVGAVSAPTSLAIDAARRFGVTLAGFIRDGSFNLYHQASPIDFDR